MADNVRDIPLTDSDGPQVFPDAHPIGQIAEAPTSLDSIVPQNTPYDSLVPDFKQTQAQGLQGSMFVAGQTTPDKAADAIKLSNKFGVDPRFAHENMDALKKADTPDFGNLIENYPGVTKYMQKPENASLSHDDLPAVQKIDQLTRYASGSYLDALGPSNSVSSGFNRLQTGILTAAGAFGILDKNNVIANLNSLKAESDQIEASKPDYEKLYQQTLSANEGDAKKAHDQYLNAAADLERGHILSALGDYYSGKFSSIGALLDGIETRVTNGKAFLYDQAEGLSNYAPILATGALASLSTPFAAPVSAAASFLAGAPIMVGDYFNQRLQKEGKTFEQAMNDPAFLADARAKSLAGGLSENTVFALAPFLGGEAGTEAKILSTEGKSQALQIAKLKAQQFGIGTTKLAATMTAAHEVGQIASGENPKITDVLDNFLHNLLGPAPAFEAIGTLREALKPRERFTPGPIDVENPEPPAPPGAGQTYDIQPEQKLLPARFPSDPVEAIKSVSRETTEAGHTLQSLQALDEMGQAVNESKTAQRVPEKIDELIQASGGTGNVYFQAKDWKDYFVTKGLGPSKEADNLLGDGGKAYEEALESGGNMAVPMGTYVSKVAPTEHYGPLLNYVKTDPAGMTFSEAERAVKELPENVKQIASQAQNPPSHEQEAKTLANQIEDQLVAAGRPPEEAKASAQIAESRMNARAAITGTSPQEAFNKYGLEIGGESKGLAEEPNKILLQSARPPQNLEELRSQISKNHEEILNSPEASQQYSALPDSFEGKLVSADVARELSPEYKSGGDLRVVATEATNDTAGEFAQKLFDEKLKEEPSSYALFLSGGPGSGKTTISRGFLRDVIDRSDVALDGVMGNYDKAVKNIDAALDSGRPVIIYHVYRSAFDAARGVAERFKLQKRTMHYNMVAQAHIRAQETFFKLADHYEDNPNVHFQVVDNSQINPKPASLSELEKVRYTQEGKSLNRTTKDISSALKEILNETAKETKAAEARVEASLSGNQAGNSSEVRTSETPVNGSSDQSSGRGPKNGPAGNALNQGGSRGQIEFGPYKALIKIGKNADASTFIHEAFHLWTKEFVDDFKSLKDSETPTDRQKQFLEDAKTMADYVGADSIENMTTDQWEKIAESGEEYLREGKAPSSALQKAFARFKAWITYLYRAMKRANVDLNDKIRGVFDRMLVAEDAIKNEPFQPISTDGMTEKQKADYAALQTELKDFSNQRLEESLMRDLKREQSKDYSMARDMTENRIRDQVNQDPVYRAISILQDGKLPDGSELPSGSFPIKLSKEAIIEKYGPDYVSGLPKGIFDKEFGLDPDIAAEMLGFNNTDNFLHSIANAPTKESAIEVATDAEMKTRYPSTIDEPQLSDEILKATHNDQKEKLLRMELEHLASNDLPKLKGLIRKVTARVPTDMEVRARAEQMIGDKNINDIRPHEFNLAEAKARAESGKLLAKGDIDGAFQAKRQELLNHELYRSAVDANDLIEKTVKSFVKMSKPDEKIAKTRDADLVNAARSLLAKFDIGRFEGKDPASYLKSLKNYDPETYSIVSDLIDSAVENAKSYNDLSYNDFVDLKNSVESLWSLAKSQKEIEIDGQKVSRDAAIESLNSKIAEFQSKKPIKVKYEKQATKWEKTKMALLDMVSSLQRVEQWVDSMDKGDIKGEFRKYLATPVQESIGKYRIAKQDYLAKFKEIIDPLKEEFGKKPIQSPELQREFTGKRELLGALLHTGNESNFDKFLRGNNWEADKWNTFIERLQKEGVLTRADYDLVQKAWDLFDELKPQSQAAHREMYGFYFNEITSKPFSVTFPSGETAQYKGGYAPAIADPIRAPDAQIRSDKEALEKFNNSFMFPTTGRGFTKSRVDSYTAPLIMDLGLVPAQLDKMLRFIHIEPAVKDVSKIVMNRGFRSHLDAFDPSISGDMLVPWLQRSAQQMMTTPTKGRGGRAIDSFFREIRSRTGMATLIGSVANVLHQYTGFSTAAVIVDPKYLRQGLWKYIRAPRQTASDIASRSDFMKERMEHQSFKIATDIDHMLEGTGKVGRAIDFAKQNGLILQRMIQNQADVIAWHGAYNKSIAEGNSEADAIRFGNSVIRRTQHLFNPEDVSRFETGPAWLRAFTQFYGYYNMRANLLAGEFQKSFRDQGFKKSLFSGKMLYIYTFGLLIPALMHEAIVQSLAGKQKDPKDDEEYLNGLLDVFFGGQVRDLTAMVPIAGPTIQAGLNRFNDKWYDDRINTSPAVSALESASGAPFSVYKALRDEKGKKRAIQDSLTLISLITGVPVAPLSRPLGYMADLSEGKEASSPFDFVRGLATGKSGK